MLKTLSVRLQELKNKGKVQLGNPKSGFGRLQEWSEGELRLYLYIYLNLFFSYHGYYKLQ